MVKSSNYDFSKYKKETDYQAEINKALQEGDYYGAAVNEQFRNTKIELEGLGDKYKPTSKYLYCINPDGTKNEAEVAKFEAQQGKTDGTKVIDPVPNDYLGMYDSMTVHTEDNSDNNKKINEHQTEVKEDIDCTYCAEETSKNISTQPKLQGEDETENESYYESLGKWLYQEPTEESYGAFMQNVAGFLDTVDSEMQNREGTYTQKNEYNSMYLKRSEQLDLVIDWGNQIIDMLEEHNDGSESSQIIMETTDLLRGYREKAEHLLYKLNSEKTETDKYTTENHWLTYTDPVGALEKINSADMKNLTDAEKADIEELIKYLSQYNTERALVDALTLMGEGKPYEELEAERDVTRKRLGVLRTGEGIYRSETTAFEKNLIKGYENYLAYLNMMMGYYKDMEYMSYKTREDYYELSMPIETDKNLTEKERRLLANDHVRDPYYYINDIYGTRGVYATSYNTLGTNFQKYDYMTESEIRTYNYIYATEGEKAANKYLDYLTDQKSYWVNEQGEYVSAATGLESRQGKDWAKKSNNLFAKGTMAAIHGADDFINNMKQLFSDEAIPESAFQYAYDYLYNDAGNFGKHLLSLVSNTVEEVPTALIAYLSTLVGHPEIGMMAAGAYAGIDEYGESMQNGGTPVEASVVGLSAGVKGAAKSFISDVINEKVPKLSAELADIWNSSDNVLMELLGEISGKVMDNATEEKIKEVVGRVFENTAVGQFEYGLVEARKNTIRYLNQDQTFQDNKYSQFSQYEQEMLKVLEKSYKDKTITRQEYEEELKRFAGWLGKDKFLYLDYIKLLGII